MMTMLHMYRNPFFHHEKHSGNINLRKVSICHYKTCVASTKIRWIIMITNVAVVQCIPINAAPPEHIKMTVTGFVVNVKNSRLTIYYIVGKNFFYTTRTTQTLLIFFKCASA